MNLLITHWGAFGDQVFTLPGIKTLREKYDKIYAGIPQKLAKSKEAQRIGNLLQQIHDIRLELESELDRRWVDSL